MDKEGTIKCNQVLNEIEKDKTISDKRKFINNQSKLLHHLHKSVYNMKHPPRITGQRKKHYESPTDQLLSPCSRKLIKYRSKCIVAKSTPIKLSFISNTK